MLLEIFHFKYDSAFLERFTSVSRFCSVTVTELQSAKDTFIYTSKTDQWIITQRFLQKFMLCVDLEICMNRVNISQAVLIQ